MFMSLKVTGIAVGLAALAAKVVVPVPLHRTMRPFHSGASASTVVRHALHLVPTGD
jgi:hypothetical protein